MNTQKYVCPLCDYIYDQTRGDPVYGIAPGTSFDSLPEAFRHGDCVATIDMFETCTCASLAVDEVTGGAPRFSKKNSMQEIFDRYPAAIDVFKMHGVDVEDGCLFSVRHLPIEECTELCGVEDLDKIVNDLNASLFPDLSVQSGKRSLGELVAENANRAKVFDEYDLDYCCGGKVSLEEACCKNGVDLEAVLLRLQECDRLEPTENSFDNASLTDLVDNIESTHHKYLKEELPRLEKLADKVARVHGARAPQMVELAYLFRNLKEELVQHTLKEEMVLFPYIRRLDSEAITRPAQFGAVANPIRCMEAEHDDAGKALVKIRQLTDDYRAPGDACGSWLALVAGLESLDKDLRTHIHKENSILFPKAVSMEESLILV
ncbi:MAG: iron-sulfur cluster repair di-iron protein [Cyanobacteriota/Melainabacteria group bacterium]